MSYNFKADFVCSSKNNTEVKMSKKIYSVRGGVLYVDAQINKQRYRFSTQKEANEENIKWLKANILRVVAEYRASKGRVLGENKTSLYDFAMASLKRNQNARRGFTTKEYEGIFHRHINPYFEYRFMEDITPLEISNWQASLVANGLSPARVRNIKIVLGFFYNEAIRLNISTIKLNPCALAGKIPQERRKDKINPFSLSEVKSLLSLADDEFRQMLTILFFTGLRTGETLALKWSDIDYENKKLNIERNLRRATLTKTKTHNSDRIVDMTEPVVKAFKHLEAHYKRHDEFVFVNTKNEPYYDGRVFAKKFKELVKLANIKGERLFYWTRHSFASIMIAEGQNINWIAKMLGHSTAKITFERYSRYVESENTELCGFLKGFFNELEKDKIGQKSS